MEIVVTMRRAAGYDVTDCGNGQPTSEDVS
jgi:methanogenic corrinoid protein MtbC1